ncbi:MAG: NAD(P)-binding domain-containing protein [Acidimicrobiia bacterium]
MRQLPDRTSTVVIGGGQAGLSVGYHLQRQGNPFVILDASDRVGDAWRNRWDSLRLFTAAWLDGLDGMPFPATWRHTPTKEEMADYLESYATGFELPVHSSTRVTRLSREADTYMVETDRGTIGADNVVVAMSSWQVPRYPDFANDLSDDIVAIHSSAYRNPGQLQPGPVLLVGLGNSGAEIALELSSDHKTLISGTPPGEVPVDIGTRRGQVAAWFIGRVVFHRILTDSTPMGRKMAREHRGEPLVRTRTKELRRAGVESVARIVGVEGGRPATVEGEALDVSNVIWCTGYDPGFDWIYLPIFSDEGRVQHQRGILPDQPGLYFVGLKFLYSVSSAQIHGVGRDAVRIVREVVARANSKQPVSTPR